MPTHPSRSRPQQSGSKKAVVHSTRSLQTQTTTFLQTTQSREASCSSAPDGDPAAVDAASAASAAAAAAVGDEGDVAGIPAAGADAGAVGRPGTHCQLPPRLHHHHHNIHPSEGGLGSNP